jgi:small-conductance mechanosensitive channel
MLNAALPPVLASVTGDVVITALVGIVALSVLWILVSKAAARFLSEDAARPVRRLIVAVGVIAVLALVLDAAGVQRHTLLVLLEAAVGLPLLFVLAASAGRSAGKHVSPQSAMLIRKAVFYGGAVVLLFIVLQQMGVRITALLGAAGIAGIAIGFAAQTSISNIICGIFLVSEKPFVIGDFIEVGGKRGIVLSIDLLSVKIRTLDNQFVRIPNETLIKQDVTTITRFPIRRLDINLRVAPSADGRRVEEVLGEIAAANVLVLDEPEPLILFTGFGEAGMEFLFAVWFAKDNFLDLRRTIMHEIKSGFEEAGIELGFPQRTLRTADGSVPMAVRIVGESAAQPEGGEAGDE